MNPFPFVSFLSDFGLTDMFVGVCHGVLARRSPHARVIDLTHDVDPGDVDLGALLLARAVIYLPTAVHLAVVDPGVGTARRGIAVAAKRGDVLVGPDNGLLLPAARALGGVAGAWELADPRYRLEPLSASFHGRDVFSPAAAALANGVEPQEFGPPVDDLAEPEPPPPALLQEDGSLRAAVLVVDRFGNLQLAARAEDLARMGLRVGDEVEVELGARCAHARFVRVFGELAGGQLGMYEDSDWHVALAVSGGSAAQMLAGRRGMVATIRPSGLARGPISVADSKSTDSGSATVGPW